MSKFLDYEGLAYYHDKMKGNLDKKADKSEIPQNVTDLNDSGNYVTQEQLGQAGVGGTPSNTTPKMDADTGIVGEETAYARGDHQHPHDTTRLATNGDGSSLTISFNTASENEAPSSGETLAEIFGKIAKWYSELGDLAYENTIDDDLLSPEIQEALKKAESALQSYTETDPTVPDWAKNPTKPEYTAAEVGAIPASEASNFARKEDIGNVYKYKGSIGTVGELPPAGQNEVGDVWNVEETDMNYGWTGSSWDPLGQVFEIESIELSEIDELMSDVA